MDYISAREAAENWSITPRRVEALCSNGQVQGAERIGNMWLIPKNTVKPIDGRTKAAGRHNKPMPDKPIEYMLPSDNEHVIEMVNGTMAMEGLPLTESDRGRLRIVLRGEVTADEMVHRLVAKHRRDMDAGQLRV